MTRLRPSRARLSIKINGVVDIFDAKDGGIADPFGGEAISPTSVK